MGQLGIRARNALRASRWATARNSSRCSANPLRARYASASLWARGVPPFHMRTACRITARCRSLRGSISDLTRLPYSVVLPIPIDRHGSPWSRGPGGPNTSSVLAVIFDVLSGGATTGIASTVSAVSVADQLVDDRLTLVIPPRWQGRARHPQAFHVTG